jgi:hypothetical protein
MLYAVSLSKVRFNSHARGQMHRQAPYEAVSILRYMHVIVTP